MDTTQSLQKEIRELEQTLVCVETNEGTFGATECCRVTGSGDPQHGNYRVMQRVGDGHRTVTGCDPEDAPGRARHINGDELSRLQRRLSDLRAKLRAAKS